VNKQDIIDIIEPVLKQRLVGTKDPTTPNQTISDVRVKIDKEYVSFDDTLVGSNFNTIAVEIRTITPKGFDRGWYELELE
jgi:hypothetical protein